jgi:hypothetical protein
MRKSLFLTIVLGLTITAFINTYAQVGASATWRVQKYDLDVNIQNEQRTLTSRAVVTVKNVSASPATSLTFRISPSAEVSSLKINDSTSEFSKSEEKLGSGTIQRISTRFASVPAGGTVTAVVDYKLAVKDNSGLSVISPVGSQMLPLAFWYPTPNSWFFSKGADAAPVHIKVNAAGMTIAASGTDSAGGFDQKLNSQPFFVAGNWDVTEANGVSVYVPKGSSAEAGARASELGSLFSEAKAFMATALGGAPDTKLRIISGRRGAGFSSAGTAIVDEAVFRRPKIDSLTAMNIAEAAAKIWLGGAINVNGEGVGVVSEGLPRYLATQFLEGKLGKDVADIERLRQRTAYAAVSKRDAPMSTVSPLDDYYYPVVANKGAMVWRILAKRVGTTEFSSGIKSASADGSVSLAELREVFAAQKPLLDYFFDQLTEMNLLAGVPQPLGGETRVSLKNTGNTDVTVDVAGSTATNERVVATTSIRAASFGEVVFKSARPIVRAEVDADKLYPQTDYSDDVAPRETTDSDPLLAAKRAFDKQDYAGAEKVSRALLAGVPRFDDLRILLGRSLLAQGRNAEAEREFKTVLDEKLPTARSMAWANVGLAEAAAKTNQTALAAGYAAAAIMIDADYGATLAARNVASSLNGSSSVDPTAKAFFSDFDKAVLAKRKADVESMIVPGEISNFASVIAGSAVAWNSQVVRSDLLNSTTMLVETKMAVRLLNKSDESGTAVYRLVKIGNAWKLAGVDVFEVR